jgi:hypothetical protein
MDVSTKWSTDSKSSPSNSQSCSSQKYLFKSPKHSWENRSPAIAKLSYEKSNAIGNHNCRFQIIIHKHNNKKPEWYWHKNWCMNEEKRWGEDRGGLRKGEERILGYTPVKL